VFEVDIFMYERERRRFRITLFFNVSFSVTDKRTDGRTEKLRLCLMASSLPCSVLFRLVSIALLVPDLFLLRRSNVP